MNNLNNVLVRIAQLQSNTSPVELSVGGVNSTGQVERNVVIVRKAPPKVVSALVAEFKHVGLCPDGMWISGEWPAS